MRLPVIVDGDTGFGNALNVQRTVRDFERAGAAMINWRTRAFPSAAAPGRQDRGSGGGDVRQAARGHGCAPQQRHADPRARTDALAIEGLEAALDRAERYLDTGVDALFIEALRGPEQMRAACERFIARPLLANMVEGGKTPVLSATELGQIGFRIVIFPGGTARAVAHAAALLRHAREGRHDGRAAGRCWTSTG